jgi:putative ribosome biogenesis GTPase RsgA
MATSGTDESSPGESSPGEPSQGAILVAVMGQTGTGKSSFINKATGKSLEVGGLLEPCTRSYS